MIHRLLTLLLCYCLAGPVGAAEDSPTLESLAAQLRPEKAIRGRFEQAKQLPFLQQPFLSTGHFYLDALGSLDWQVEQPAASRMQVTGAGVSLDGRPVRDHGIGQLISRLMSSFLSGNLAGLQRYFSLKSVDQSPPWHIELTAKGRLQQAIEGVSLSGGDYLESITIREAGGGSTAISLSDITPAYTAEPTETMDD